MNLRTDRGESNVRNVSPSQIARIVFHTPSRRMDGKKSVFAVDHSSKIVHEFSHTDSAHIFVCVAFQRTIVRRARFFMILPSRDASYSDVFCRLAAS